MPKVPEYGNYQASLGTGDYSGVRTEDLSRYNPYDPGALATPLAKAAVAVKKMQEDIDDARVTDKITQLRRYATDRRTGDSGFLTMHGLDALLPDDDGRGLADREDVALQTYGEDLMKDLTPAQKRLFKERASPVYEQQYGFAMQHVFSENEQYRVNGWKNDAADAVDTMVRSYMDTDITKDCMARAEYAAQRIADHQGLDAEGTRQLIRQMQGDVVFAGVAGALAKCDQDPSQVVYAQSLLDQYGGRTSAPKLLEWRMKVNEQLDRNLRYDLTQRASNALRSDPSAIALAYAGMTGGKIEKGAVKSASAAAFAQMIDVETGGRQFEKGTDGLDRPIGGGHRGGTVPANEEERAYGISQIQERNAKIGAQRLGIEWSRDKYRYNADYNRAVGQAFFEMLVEKYGGELEKAVAAYHSGQGTVDKAIAKAAKDGKPWTAHLGPEGQAYVAKVTEGLKNARSGVITDAAGRKISPLDPRYAEASKQWFSRKEAEEYLIATNERAKNDYRFREETLDDIMSKQNQEMNDYSTEQANLVGQVMDLVMQGKTPPQSLWGQINYAQQQAIRDFQRRLQTNDKSGDLDLAAWATAQPERWSQLSEREMLNAVAAMPEQYRGTLEFAWRKAQYENADAADQKAMSNIRLQWGQIDPTYQADMGNVRSNLQMLMKASGTWPDDPQEQSYLTLRATEFASRWAQLNGVELKKDGQMQRALAEFFNASTPRETWFGLGKENKPVWDIKVSELNNRGRASGGRIVHELANNMRAANGWEGEASDQEVRDVFLSVMMEKTPTLAWTKPDGTQIAFDDQMRRFLNARAGRELSLPELLRAQLRFELSGETPPRAEIPNARYVDIPFGTAGVVLDDIVTREPMTTVAQ